MEEGRILDRLELLVKRTDEIHDQLKQLNGTVRDHGNWIYGRNRICDEHMTQIDDLAEETGKLHDYQVQLNSAFKASKVLFFVLWTLTLALAGVGGAFLGAISRKG